MKQRSWSGGDRVSRALLSLASDVPLPAGTAVTGELVALARRHGLIGILAGHVTDPLVRAVHSRQEAREHVMEPHLRRLLELLDSAGVRTAVVKGPKLSLAYPRPQQRPYSDLDLVVEADALGRAIDVIAGDPAVVEIPEKGPKAAKRDVVLGDPSGIRFNVDLHWDLFSYTQLRGSADGANGEAWDMAKPVTDSTLGPHWDLPPSHVIGFLATHAVLDHRFRLILFRDFFEMARRGVDWADLTEVAGRWGLRSTTYLAWYIAAGAVGASVPGEFLEAVRPRSAALSYLERAIPRLDMARFHGHTAHPVNLASVLLNDSRASQLTLLLRAPGAFPHWRKRVAEPEEPGNSPRTLIVVSTDRRRGAEVFTERLADGLSRRGWVVDAVSLKGTGEEPRADVQALVVDPESSGRFQWAVARALRKKVRTYRPELVVANGGATLRYSLFARIGTGAKLAYIGIGEPGYWIRSRSSLWLNRLMLRLTDMVIAVSETTRRQLVSIEPTIDAKSRTLFTGLDPDLTDLAMSSQGGPLRIMMLGSLTDEKDPSLALRSIAAVPGAILRFVGTGPLADRLAAEAAELGISERVEFVGSVDDVKPHLVWAQVLILTSRTEGLPGAILEASAAGLAVVSVDVGGVREAILDGETGYVSDRDQDELASRLRLLDADRDHLQDLGRRGREHVRENFLIEDVIDRYVSVLREVTR